MDADVRATDMTRVRGWARVAVLVAVLGGGCATGANYRTVVQSWIGAPATDLVRTWGAPTSTFKAPNGNEIYIYDSQALYSTPAPIGPVYGPYHRGWGPWPWWWGSETYLLQCRTEFEIGPDQRIVRFLVRGNNCVAGAPEKDERYRYEWVSPGGGRGGS